MGGGWAQPQEGEDIAMWVPVEVTEVGAEDSELEWWWALREVTEGPMRPRLPGSWHWTLDEN